MRRICYYKSKNRNGSKTGLTMRSEPKPSESLPFGKRKANHLRMKSALASLVLCCTLALSAQEADRFTNDNSGRPRNPIADQMTYVPNQVLVKFKDNVVVNSGTQLKSAGISSVDKLLRDNGVIKVEQVFPSAPKLKSAQIVKGPHGEDILVPRLDNTYMITVPDANLKSASKGNTSPDMFRFMEELKALPEVEYVEPNYVFSIGDFKPAGPEMTMQEAMEQKRNTALSQTASGLVPNDPLYNSQWDIPATNIDDVWNTNTGHNTSIIGILDTGVDWNHPDLADNIWKNDQEIPDNGKDDDGDGKIDDIRGWDFVNNDNNPTDDNAHGTHCAGIAAAVGNNGKGIAGANWHAKIMPVKVFQSSGRGDAATIAQGITYAVSKGATVISMSFGSYAESSTMKNALINAYTKAILVAAAGNDHVPIGPCTSCAPHYPAAYSFILGVEANGTEEEADFSNYDQDGPVFSKYPELLNYELKAPGVGILSCVPGGNYREFNGTSMAAPLIAGAISLYREQRPNESKEMLFGNFINSSEFNINKNIDLLRALNISPIPKIDIVSYELSDPQGDKDGKPDAGETIELKVKVRNTWGQANDVKVGIDFGEFEDHSKATIETNEASVGAISAYATELNTVPLKIKIAKDAVDSHDLVFKLKTWYDNHQGEKEQKIILKTENAAELKGVLENTLQLTASKSWVVSNSFKIGPTGVLIIAPGTHLKLEKSISNLGKILAIGKNDSIITIEGPFTMIVGGGSGTFKHVHFQRIDAPFDYSTSPLYLIGGNLDFEYCKFSDLYAPDYIIATNGTLEHCEFLSIKGGYHRGFSAKEIKYSNFVNTQALERYYTGFVNAGEIAYCNFSNSTKEMTSVFANENVKYNNILGNSNFFSSNGGVSTKLPDNYWGTTDSVRIQGKIHDFWDDPDLALVKLNPKLTKPSPKAHACVWKVLVNGKDAQDEFDKLDPLGVGTHKFEVYFNRPMDIKYTPNLSMGVREPFNQVEIAENGSWSADSLVYTVYKTLTLTASNGLNRIKVTNGKDMTGIELIPEFERFNVNVQTCASASAEFQAKPGLGKVELEWNKDDLADGLGYNMYRMEQLTDSTTSKPVMINSSLIADAKYIDCAVTPNKKYFYYYKIIRTNLSETDSSKIVASTPYTASKGDANGDLKVNVLDVTAVVAYLLNNNPQPFIQEAADVNSDKNINVLDVVGVVNLALPGGQKSAIFAQSQQVHLYLQNDTLFADASTSIGGIQVDLGGVSSADEIQKLETLEGFESGYCSIDNGVRLIYYSLSGKTIQSGNRIPLLRLKKGSGVSEAIFADQKGNSIPVNYLTTDIWNLSDKLDESTAELGQNYPNPLEGQTTIPVRINQPVDEAIVHIINVLGQEVKTINLINPEVGEHLVTWNSGKNKGLFGYTLEILRGQQRVICSVKKMIVQ